MNDLINKNIIITGASRGIGKCIAENFFRFKSNLFLISRDQNKLDHLKSKLKKINSNQIIENYSIDVTNSELINEIINNIYKKYNKIDVLVNNAGITDDSIIARMKYEQWSNVINTNLNGTFNCCKAVSKYMIKQRNGKIVNISSIVGQIGNKGQVNYAASKAGIIGLTKSLAKELAPRNIQVNAINPGYIKTDMTSNFGKNIELDKIPLNRYGNTIDISNMVCFLSSEKANYITGQTINIDGGLAI